LGNVEKKKGIGSRGRKEKGKTELIIGGEGAKKSTREESGGGAAIGGGGGDWPGIWQALTMR